MTDEQAEKILRELRAIKQTMWLAILAAGLVVIAYSLTARPAPPPVVSVSPPR